MNACDNERNEYCHSRHFIDHNKKNKKYENHVERITCARDKHLAADNIWSEEYNWNGMRITVLILIKE